MNKLNRLNFKNQTLNKKLTHGKLLINTTTAEKYSYSRLLSFCVMCQIQRPRSSVSQHNNDKLLEVLCNSCSSHIMVVSWHRKLQLTRTCTVKSDILTSNQDSTADNNLQHMNTSETTKCNNNNNNLLWYTGSLRLHCWRPLMNTTDN